MHTDQQAVLLLRERFTDTLKSGLIYKTNKHKVKAKERGGREGGNTDQTECLSQNKILSVNCFWLSFQKPQCELNWDPDLGVLMNGSKVLDIIYLPFQLLL